MIFLHFYLGSFTYLSAIFHLQLVLMQFLQFFVFRFGFSGVMHNFDGFLLTYVLSFPPFLRSAHPCADSMSQKYVF